MKHQIDEKELKSPIEHSAVHVCTESDRLPARLDSFLLTLFPDYSRSYFQNLIDRNLVFVDGKNVSKHFILKNGNIIAVNFPKPTQPNIEPQKIDFDIINIQEDFMIINKPAGLTVHHTKETGIQPTLVHGLLYKFAEFENFDDTDRPGIVHRLDKDTSGLLLVARNQKAHIAFSEMFKQRSIHKTYLAVVKGHPAPEGSINLPITRHNIMRHKMTHVGQGGREALTHYTVLRYYKECALVSVRLVTGRTHQIRVHFAAIGHGLLGDTLYGVKSNLIARQALHAWKLNFNFRSKNYSFHCHVPKDILHLLHALKSEDNIAKKR